MDIYVIDPFKSTEPHFPIIGIISAYKSLLWNNQLYGLGYFEMVVPATQENLSNLDVGKFLVKSDDIEEDGASTYYNNAMVIRKVELSYDADNGYMLTVSGKSIKDILSQRIVWYQISETNITLTSLIYMVLYQNVTNPVGHANDKVLHWQGVVSDLQDELDDLNDAKTDAYNDWQDAIEEFGEDSPQAVSCKERYDNLTEACENKQVEIDEASAKVTFWMEQQLLMASRDIPYVDAGVVYIEGFTPPRVTVQLHGENIGEWMENICTENKLGWEAFLTPNGLQYGFVVGQDRSSTVIFSPEFDNLKTSSYVKSQESYKNGGQCGGEGEGEAQTVVKIVVPSSGIQYVNQYLFEAYVDGSGVSSNGEIITESAYKNMLKQYGLTEITQFKLVESFTGEIEPEGVFKLGVDFKMGDIVTISNEKGMTSSARLIETIFADDENGTQTQATFDEMEV